MVGRALKAGLVRIEAHALREHGLGNYRQVDDTPYGGGSGMVTAAGADVRRDRKRATARIRDYGACC